MSRVIPALKERLRGVKALVIQSDDWGYCGWTASRASFKSLTPLLERRYGSKGLIWGNSTLEAPEDLEMLFQLLEGHSDTRGRHPAFQAGYVTGNPDYQRMQEEGFRTLHNVFLPDIPPLWQRGELVAKAREGMERGVWHPVYHGASHFNVGRWLQRLAVDPDTRAAAAEGCFLGEGNSGDFEFGPLAEKAALRPLLREGLQAFQHSFGFFPQAAILPAYFWGPEAEEALAREGVGILHGKNCQVRRQNALERGRGKLYNLFGWKDSAKSWQISCGDYRLDLGLRYLVRNVFFEPYLDWAWHGRSPEETVAAAVEAVEQAWRREEPAVLITHRINYVGWHGETRRSLDCLDRLIRILSFRHEFYFWQDREAAQQDAEIL